MPLCCRLLLLRLVEAARCKKCKPGCWLRPFAPPRRPSARRRAPLPRRLAAAAEALFQVRREAPGGDLAAAAHARDLLDCRRRVRLAKHVGRAARAGQRRQRARRRRGRRRRGRGREAEARLAVRLDGDLFCCRCGVCCKCGGGLQKGLIWHGVGVCTKNPARRKQRRAAQRSANDAARAQTRQQRRTPHILRLTTLWRSLSTHVQQYFV